MIEDHELPWARLCISECERYFEVKNGHDGEITCRVSAANVSLCQHFMYRHEDKTTSVDAIVPTRLDNGDALVVYTSARLSDGQEHAVTLDLRKSGGVLEMTERDAFRLADMLDNYARLLNKRRQRETCDALHGRWIFRLEQV